MTTEPKKDTKQWLDVTKQQKVGYCVPIWLRDLNIESNIKAVKGRIQPHYEDRAEPIAVVCYGPSLNDTWEEIKKFKYVLTCSGAHKFLLERGIVPTWDCNVDPREHKVQLMGPPHKDVEYLVASTCSPKLVEHLQGYNVKLWHIFDGTDDAQRTLPAGEWSLFGGASAGLRALALARFLGFKDLHVFGMDGCESEKYGKHAAAHPNQPKDHQLCEYGGKTYKTTASLAECARQTPHEIDQLNDVTATFYGEGLTQAIMRDHKKKAVPKGTPTVGFVKPELISPEAKELNARLHKDNLMYGVGGAKHAKTVLKLAESIKAESILDYGCGKGLLAKSIPRPLWEYDPAIPGKDESPRPADLVVSTDVLEHIEPDKLNFVLADLKRCIKKVGYFVIDTQPSTKSYADGRNAHLIQQNDKWWRKKLEKFFTIGSIEVVGKRLLHIIVGPKTKEGSTEEITNVGDVKFYTPNTVTKWRANTLLTKEPITIEWINSMKSGEVLYDVGANVGGYTCYAGSKGVRVYAFEPEAENYALLVRNMVLNKIEPNAYCLAISNQQKLGTLNLSQIGVGGSCHTFGEAQDKVLHQGCFGTSLDLLLDSGLPQPDYLKIDVDGLESNVISGAKNLLKNVKSLLVEINTNSESHQAIVKHLAESGFVYDPAQVEKSIRKDGPFKGCAEYLFSKGQAVAKKRKSRASSVEKYLIEKIQEAEIRQSPSPYIYIENVWPEKVYKDILNNLPEQYEAIGKVRPTKGYDKRTVAVPQVPFWNKLGGELRAGVLRKALCEKFGISSEGLTDEILLIRDQPGYKIGPHTDSPVKVISALFYLPKDESQIEAGTSLYVPLKEGFTCAGGPHYKFEEFRKVETLPFKPNSLFAFLKTSSSFHGVEPYLGEKPRDVLLYDIRRS